jgi:glyoxylase-like metal-dependent hydrolase (beta-lactamase superfamily II)
MTHMHNDHAGGLSHLEDGQIVPSFPKATIYVSQIEWDEIRNPNARTRGTYPKENWQAIAHQVETFDDELCLLDGAIELRRTGGHSKGHSIVLLHQGEKTMIHMADLLLTHAHRNPLWVGAVDDYPMDSIAAKTYWMNKAYAEGYKFFFYHDPFYAVLQFDEMGQKVTEAVERIRPVLVPFTDKQDKGLKP